MIQKYKPIIIAVGILLLLLIGWSLFSSAQFRVSSTTPDHRNYPASLGRIKIFFSQPLDVDGLRQRLADDPGSLVVPLFDSKVTVTVEADYLQVVFQNTPLPGKYALDLRDITAADGDTLTTELPLVIKDIPYKQLDKDEKALYDQLVGETSEGSIVDEYPILGILPYESRNYKISYRFEEETKPPTVIITMKTFPPGNNARPATAEETAAYLASVRTYRNEALAFITSKGFSLNDYPLEYTEVVIRNEFPQGKPQ